MHIFRDIHIEHIELTPGVKIVLPTIDLEIETPEHFSANSLSFLCRRIRPEYCANKTLLPQGKELLMSDIFEYRTSSTHFNGFVKIGVPMYSYPDPYENVFLKTDMGIEHECFPSDRVDAIRRNEVHLTLMMY